MISSKLLFVFVFILILLPVSFSVDCPFGIVNDTAPGVCAKYVDTNTDGYCDLSEQEEELLQSNAALEPNVIVPEITGKQLKELTVEETAAFYKIDKKYFLSHISDYYKIPVSYSDTFLLLHDNYGVEPDVVKGFAEEILLHHGALETVPVLVKANAQATKLPKYVFLPILITAVILYVMTYILSKKKVISLMMHKKIWNVILTVSFLASAILGIFLVIRINYGLLVYFPFNILYWHVEFGIVMAVVSVFHIIWHLNYYKILFKKN